MRTLPTLRMRGNQATDVIRFSGLDGCLIQITFATMKTMLGTAKSIRRVMALGLLLSVGTSTAEAVASPVGDGSMHHESNLEAASHRSVVGLEHEHLNEGIASDAVGAVVNDGGDHTDHEHPDGGDHCTHVHGAALVPQLADAIPSVAVALLGTVPVLQEDPIYTHVLHPPRA
jgi:hypothetical protein